MKKFLSVLLAVMMVFSTVSFAAPSLAGTADTAVELPLDALYEEVTEVTADLAAELPEDTSVYGEMIFEINFDNLNSISSQSIMFAEAGWINPNAEEYDSLYSYANISFTAWPTYSIKERAYGDKYLELSGGTGYAVTLLSSNTTAGFQTKDGVYTLTADVYRPDAMPFTTRFSGGSSEDTPIQDFSNLDDAGWGSIILQHDPSCFGNGGHANPFTSIADAKMIKFHRNGGTDTKTVGYDNIRLYYKPLTVNVTVTAGSKTVTVPVSTAGVYASEFAAALDLDFYQTVASVEIGGVTYDMDDVIYLTSDCEAEAEVATLDADEYDAEKGLVIYNIDFEQAEIDTEIPASGADFKITDYATSIAAGVMSHTPDNWHLNSNGIAISIMADPANPSNKVAGSIGATSAGYPMLQILTNSNGANARYGFIEDPNLIWTVEYDYYDTTADGIAIRLGGKSSISENEGFSKWATVEDVPVEESHGRTASTWYKNYGIMTPEKYSRMGGSDEISFIKLHSASPNNADLYWDNIKVYYKPVTTTVNINKGAYDVYLDKATLENVSTTGVTVSVLLDEAGFEYDRFRYTLKGVTVGDGKNVYAPNEKISLGGKVTVNLVLEEIDLTGWAEDGKGYLLFDIDFNDPSAATVFTANTNNNDYKLVDFASKVNPMFTGSENWKLTNSGMDIVGIEDGALKFQWDGTGQWPQILIGNPSNNPGNELVGENGYYYVHAEYKILGSVDSELASIAIQSNGYKDGVHNGPNGVLAMGNDFYASRNDLVADQWLTIEGASKSTWTNDADGIDNDDINKITTVFTHSTAPKTPGGCYLMDNIKLYWKPANVKVTVYGGSNADYETVTLTVPSSMSVDELIARLPGSDYGKITGLADMDGNKIDTFAAMSNTSLVAVWTPWVVLDGSQDFPVDESNGATKTQYSMSYGDQTEIGNGGGDVTAAVSWMYGNGFKTVGGNLYRTHRGLYAGENNGTKPALDYDIPAVHSHDSNGNIREEIFVNVPANNDAEYVLTKWRYNNVPNLNDYADKFTVSADGLTLTYLDRLGETRVFKLAPDYNTKYYIQLQNNAYQYGGGEEFGNNALMVEGEWVYDFLPVTAAMKETGVKKVIVQRYNLFDGLEIEYDYARFVKLGEEEEVVLPEIPGAPVKIDAPTTHKNADVRLVSEDHKKNGIRFLADVTKKTDELAVTVGFVVASEEKAAATGSYNNVTVDADFARVGYKRLEGEEKTDYFGKEDEYFTMSAVLLNIGDHYTDLIVARPFVAVDGNYVYGEAVVTCLYDELAKLYFVDPSDPENSELTDYFYNLLENDEDLAYYIEDIMYIVNEW